MFRKLLIANRGEIACRIAKTATEMGIATVAVYSDADADAQHVQRCNEAVRIGSPPASDSYLCIGKILSAAGKPMLRPFIRDTDSCPKMRTSRNNAKPAKSPLSALLRRPF